MAKLFSVNPDGMREEGSRLGRNFYKEAFIKVGQRNAVYGTEVSKEEAYANTTEKKVKSRMMKIKEEMGLTMTEAVKYMCSQDTREKYRI